MSLKIICQKLDKQFALKTVINISYKNKEDSMLNLLSKRILAASSLMMHGTSSNLAEQIKNEGVKSNPKNRVWDEDKSSGSGNTETLPGASYWTNNLLTATGAAGNATSKFGGNPVVVFARIDTGDRDVELDEDHFPNVERAVSADIKSLINGWILSVYKNKEDYDRKGTIDKLIQKLHETVPHIPKERFEKERQTLMDLIDAWFEFRHLEENQHKYEFKKDATPENISKARDTYRKQLAKTLEKFHFLSTAKDQFVHNVRFKKNMTYNGRHKIVMIAEFEKPKEKDKYGRRINITYKSGDEALNFLIETAKKVLGHNMLITYKGNPLYDEPKEEK